MNPVILPFAEPGQATSETRLSFDHFGGRRLVPRPRARLRLLVRNRRCAVGFLARGARPRVMRRLTPYFWADPPPSRAHLVAKRQARSHLVVVDSLASAAVDSTRKPLLPLSYHQLTGSLERHTRCSAEASTNSRARPRVLFRSALRIAVRD